MVPPYLRESSVTTSREAAMVGAMLAAACLVYLLGVVIAGLLG
jgi:hypothetical protein